MIIPNGKIVADLASNLVSRTYEVYQYDLNIGHYEHIVATTSGEYPEHMQFLENLPYDQAVIQCAPEDLSILAEVQQNRNASHLLKTEMMERTKANSILLVIDAQLKNLTTDTEYDIAVSEAVARRG